MTQVRSEFDVDVAVVGGGMVGAALSVALAPSGVRIALIERQPHDARAQPSFDERTTALSNASRRVLDTLGVWRELETHATPIRKIHVSERGRFGFARLDAREQGLEALGFVVPNRELGRVLWSRIAQMPNVTVLCPAELRELSMADSQLRLNVDSQVNRASVSARLVVAADGADSKVAAAVGIRTPSADYHQLAVVTTVLPQQFHHHVAYERFTDQGPLALLPLSDGRCALVLTLGESDAAVTLSWPDAKFLTELQDRFGFRLGRFLQVGARVSYPLALRRSESTSAARCVLIGNAAQTLHPIAGMGFNLGLRDAACLAELVTREAAGEEPDVGNAVLLRKYDEWRARDRRGVIAFTDGLVRLFANPLALVGTARNMGLILFDLLPPAKSALSRLSSGGARAPRLARGASLTAIPRGGAGPA